MPRLAGVDIPNDKRIDVSLTYVYGIGPVIANKIISQLNLDPSTRANKLTDDEINKISSLINEQFRVEGELRRDVAQNIARLRSIKCYRGFRHIRGLPCRGQQTQTNARTRKGKRKTIANKKG